MNSYLEELARAASGVELMQKEATAEAQQRWQMEKEAAYRDFPELTAYLEKQAMLAGLGRAAVAGGKAVWAGARNAGTAAFNGARQMGGKAWNAIKQNAPGTWGSVSQTGGKVWDATRQAGSKVWDATRQAGGKMMDRAKSVWDKMKEAYNTPGNAAAGSTAPAAAASTTTAPAATVGAQSNGMMGRVRDMWNNTADRVGGWVNKDQRMLNQMRSEIKGPMSQADTEAFNALQSEIAPAVRRTGNKVLIGTGATLGIGSLIPGGPETGQVESGYGE